MLHGPDQRSVGAHRSGGARFGYARNLGQTLGSAPFPSINYLNCAEAWTSPESGHHTMGPHLMAGEGNCPYFMEMFSPSGPRFSFTPVWADFRLMTTPLAFLMIKPAGPLIRAAPASTAT